MKIIQGKRRRVDAHGFRGQSLRKSGWNGVNLALSRGDERITRLSVSPEAGPVPAMASKIQQQQQPPLFFALELQDAVV